MTSAEHTPVIVGIGEITDRPQNLSLALEPIALMAKALERAEADAGGGFLGAIDSLDLVGQITWRYADPVNSLARMVGVNPIRAVNESMGGETPIRLLHEAALRISRGESQVCAIVGGEAMHARGAARRAGVQLDWTPMASREETVKVASSSLEISSLSRRLGVTDPMHIYPLYENAWQAAIGQTPEEGRAAAAALWAKYAAVAAANPCAWIRTGPSAEEIATVSADNRLIAWPYSKLMVANPMVNQGSAIIVTSLARAWAAGVPEDRLVHIWGGAAAKESEDYLRRDRYDRSAAQAAVLNRAVEIVGGYARAFDHLELYSCFPVVPKMALAALGLGEDVTPTVTGGVTFFGGPLNNYMSHAACAMVRRVREAAGSVGLLYGQGGVVTKHHTLVVGGRPAPAPMPGDYSVQNQAEAAREEIPPLVEGYAGPAAIETWTVLYDRQGDAAHGAVVARTPDGERLLAKVDREDAASLARLVELGRSAVGEPGLVRTDAAGDPVWTLARAPLGVMQPVAAA